MIRKKLKKFFICGALAFAVMNTVFAGNEEEGYPLNVSVNYNTGSLEVTYQSVLEYDTYVTMYVARSSDAEKFTDFENAVRIEQGICPAEDSVTVNIKLDRELDGLFDVFAVPGGVNNESGCFKTLQPVRILGETVRREALATINGASETECGGEIYTRLKEVLNIEETSCPEWKSSYLYVMKNEDYGGEFTDFNQIDSAMKAADCLHLIRSTDSASVISEQIESGTVPGLDAENKDYIAYKEDFIKRFEQDAEAADVKSVAAAGKCFDEAAAVTAFNKRDIGGVASALTEYADIIGISSDKDRISYVGANVVARKLEGKTFGNVSDIKTAVYDAINSLDGRKENSSGGGGGGTSSSKKGSAAVFPAPDIKTEAAGPDSSATGAGGTFSDVAYDHWAKNAIDALAEQSVINGYSDGTFRCADPVKREEFVQMIVKAFGVEKSEVKRDFQDVADGHWAADALDRATGAGIINGVSEKCFGIGMPVTRQDMAVIVVRALHYKGVDLTGNAKRVFTDESDISEYAAEAVKELTVSGIINGFQDGSFRPAGILSRAEAAKVLYNILNLTN